MANHPRRNSRKPTHLYNIMHYELSGHYHHKHPEQLARGQAVYSGGYSLTWAKGRGHIAFRGYRPDGERIEMPGGVPVIVQTDDAGPYIDCGNTVFRPAPGELDRVDLRLHAAALK